MHTPEHGHRSRPGDPRKWKSILASLWSIRSWALACAGAGMPTHRGAHYPPARYVSRMRRLIDTTSSALWADRRFESACRVRAGSLWVA
jgi:hypothetical protein